MTKTTMKKLIADTGAVKVSIKHGTSTHTATLAELMLLMDIVRHPPQTDPDVLWGKGNSAPEPAPEPEPEPVTDDTASE